MDGQNFAVVDTYRTPMIDYNTTTIVHRWPINIFFTNLLVLQYIDVLFAPRIVTTTPSSPSPTIYRCPIFAIPTIFCTLLKNDRAINNTEAYCCIHSALLTLYNISTVSL